MNTKTKLANKICAIMVIVTMLVSNFWLVGEVAVSYAIDMAKTSSNNVELSAYFVDENGNETESKEKSITEDESLYVKVRVKNEGFFSGVLKLENNNFEIDKDFLDEGVQEITESGEVVLKQINAGTDEVIELKVKPIKKDELKLTEIQGTTTVKLEGEYTNSKNVEKKKVARVEGETEVTLNWILPEESTLELSGEVFTNKEYEIDNEDKRVVQILVNSKILNSYIPAKVNEFEIDKLEGTEEITVQGRSLEEKNRKISYEEKTEDNGDEKIIVKIDNEDENLIVCNDEEEFIVTYILDKDADTINKQVSITEAVRAYDGKNLEQKVGITTGEEKEGIITYNLESEKEIYKGKIKTGEEREYQTQVKINVNFEKLTEEIELTENAAKYKAGDEEKTANIFYKSTKINKEEFTKIFGEDGYLTIIDEKGNVIANINKESSVDDEGNIVVNYQGENKILQIKTSKPVEKGTLIIENTKVIRENEKTKDEINQLTQIEESIINKKTKITSNTKLTDTVTEAKLEANVDTLTTLETNKNVKIAVTLLNDDETRDLYQNPKIRVILPKQVRDVNAKCKLFYGNGLILGKTALLQEDGKYIIEINLDGIQSTYNAEEVRGTTVMIYAELGLDKLATNSDEKIILNYTNDLATSYKDEGKEELPIKIQAREGVITTNNIEEYGISTIGDEGTKQINIDENTKKDVSVKISAINNEETRISDIKILGHFPTGEDDNLGIQLNSGIEVINQENAKVYYSDKENPTTDIEDEENGWKESANTATTKSYLIVTDSLAKGDKFEAKYNVTMPEELPNNSNAEENYSISYLNVQSGVIKTENATTLRISSPAEEKADDKLDVMIKQIVGNDTIEEGTNTPVTKGEIIRYQVDITNITDEEITDIKVEENAPKGVKGLDYVKTEQQEDSEDDGMAGNSVYHFEDLPTEVTIEEFYKDYFIDPDEEHESPDVELPSDEITMDSSNLPLRITKMISSIGPKETKKINFYVRADNVEENLNTEFKVKFDDKEITKNLTNTVNNSDINVKLIPGHAEASRDYLIGGNQYMYELEIGNYVKNNAKSVNIQIITNDMFDVNCIAYDKADEAVIANNTKQITIEDLDESTNQISNSTKIRVYVIPKEDIKDNNIAQIYAKVSYGDTTLRTNKLANKIKVRNVTLTAETENQGGEKSVGDYVEYKFTLKNDENGIAVYNILLQETFSSYIDIKEVLVNGSIVDADDYDISSKFYTEDENISKSSDTEDVLELMQDLESGQTKEIIVRGEVNTLAGRRLKEGDKISTKIVASDYKGVIAESDEVNHVFKPQETDMPDSSTKPDNPVNPNTPQTPDDPDKNNTDNQNTIGDNNTDNQNKTEDNTTDDQNKTDDNTTDDNTTDDDNKGDKDKTYSISGIAWLDENANGGRESKEQRLSGINVNLLDLATNESKKTITTNDGTYTFSGIKKGKYLLMFEYDTEKYMLTTYQADGVNTNINSDVENVTMMLDGVEKRVSTTDTIEVTDKNVTDIDIGLLQAKIFDLELEKTISKVTVINNEGTKTTNYNNTFAKTEINAKYLEGSTVIIEYKIKVKNTGEIAGYAKSIVDYKPVDLQFDSKLNSGWYQSGNNLYSTNLSNTKIEPGETKELTLVLTKTMTENNIGLINNLAEIQESYNAMGIEDKDSTPGDKQKEDDDLGSCNLSIGVKTGAAISYIAFTTSVLTMLIAGAYLINRIIIKKNNL